MKDSVYKLTLTSVFDSNGAYGINYPSTVG